MAEIRRTPSTAGAVLAHLCAVAMVLLVVVRSGLPLWEYIVGVAWFGWSLTLVRSFVEHRSVEDGSPAAVVPSNWFFSLLFLHNNLHHTHHRQPGLAWFRLPAAHAASGCEPEVVAGAGWYRGYGEIARRFWARPVISPVHPRSLATCPTGTDLPAR